MGILTEGVAVMGWGGITRRLRGTGSWVAWILTAGVKPDWGDDKEQGRTIRVGGVTQSRNAGHQRREYQGAKRLSVIKVLKLVVAMVGIKRPGGQD